MDKEAAAVQASIIFCILCCREGWVLVCFVFEINFERIACRDSDVSVPILNKMVAAN